MSHLVIVVFTAANLRNSVFTCLVTLMLLKRSSQLFCRISVSMGLPDVLMIEVMHFGGKKNDVVPSSVHIRKHMTSVGIAGDVNRD